MEVKSEVYELVVPKDILEFVYLWLMLSNQPSLCPGFADIGKSYNNRPVLNIF